VTRGTAGLGELYGIKFIFQKGTTTFAYTNTHLPRELESRTYSFLLFGENKTDSVKIAGIALVNGKQVTLDVADEADLRTDTSIIPKDMLEECSVPVSPTGRLPPEPPDVECTGKR
jgi:hypothetical protein